MMVRKYFYTSVDGNHFPDSDLGDDLYYAIDYSCWLASENDTLESIDWIVPEGISSDESFISGTNANIKISSDTVGSFKLICNIHTVENGKQQTNAVPMILRVF